MLLAISLTFIALFAGIQVFYKYSNFLDFVHLFRVFKHFQHLDFSLKRIFQSFAIQLGS